MPRIEATIQKTPSKAVVGLVALNIAIFFLVTIIAWPRTRRIISLINEIKGIDEEMYRIERGYIDFKEVMRGISGHIWRDGAIEAFKKRIRERIFDGGIVLWDPKDYERWLALYKRFTELNKRLLEERHGYILCELGFVPRAPSILGTMTSSLLHSGFLSLLLNMLFLWIVGPWVEEDLGSRSFLLLYLGIGIVSSLWNRFISPDSDVPVVGGEGAVSGLIGFFILNYYGIRMRFFLEFPSIFLLPIWIILQLFMTTMERGDVARSQDLLVSFVGLILGGLVAFTINKMREEKGRVLKISSSQCARMVAHAQELYTLAQFEKARWLFTKILAKEPENFDAHIGMGRLYLKANQMDEAMREYSLAIEIGIRQGRDDVIKVYEELRSLHPGAILSPKDQYQLGRYMAERGEFDLAIRTFNDLVMTYKGDRLVWRSLFECGRISMKLNRPDDAIDYYEKALLRNPETEWVDIIRKEIERAKSAS